MVANQRHSLQPSARMKLQIKEMMTLKEKRDERCSGSNSDLMLDFVQKPHVKHIAINKAHKEEEETRLYHGDEILNHSSDTTRHSHQSSRRKLERKLVFDSNIPPQKIVVLKPNTQNHYSDKVDSQKHTKSPEVNFFRSKGKDVRDIAATEKTSQMKEGFESVPKVITTTSTITFDQNDRLDHSLCKLSEPSLFMDAKNRMLKRWNTNDREDNVGMLGTGSRLGEMLSVGVVDVKDIFDASENLDICGRDFLPSFHDPNHKIRRHEDHGDEKVAVHSDPLNLDRRKDIAYKKLRYNKRCESSKPCDTFSNEFGNYLPEPHFSVITKTSFENEGLTIHQTPSSDIDDDASYEASLVDEEASFMAGDAKSSGADGNTSIIIQVSEESESIKEIDYNNQFSFLEVSPSEDISSDPDCFKRLNSRLEELKKQLHLLQFESTSTANNLSLAPNVKQLRQRSSALPESILKASGIYKSDLDTSSYPWETIHHPTDPRLFYRLKKYYFEGTTLQSEKQLLNDYTEQTFIRTSKLMVAYPWVNPEKREGQLTLNKFKIEDQICKVIDEIEKEDEEDFLAIFVEKDPEWVQPTNEIDILGKLVAEIVLNNLVLEVIYF